jgi:hypothetical protein
MLHLKKSLPMSETPMHPVWCSGSTMKRMKSPQTSLQSICLEILSVNPVCILLLLLNFYTEHHSS